MDGVVRMETATRIGFAARGLMYLLIAFLALSSGQTEDGAGALKTLDGTGGRALLAVMALGFLAYGVWRLAEAFIDGEGHGSDAKGLAKRVGGGVSGVIHLGLGVYAAKLAAGRPAESGGSEASAETALSLPGGEGLLMVAAVVLLVTAGVQFAKAVKGGFLKHLDTQAAAQAWVKWVGRAGYVARGVVFAITALFLWRAAQAADASQTGGIEAALDWLTGWPRLALAAGLGLFGVFSLVEARYRRINDPKVVERLAHAGRRLTS